MEKQQLNITMGTDVVLHDVLIFDDETFDPSLSTGIEANLVNSLGKRTSLDVEVVDDYLVIDVPWDDSRNAGCYGLEVKGVCNERKWSTYADALIRYTRATREGQYEVEVQSDYYDITQVVSYRYTNSPIDKVTVDIDGGYGDPSVDSTYDGKNLDLQFHNLKGNGIVSVVQTTTSTEDEGVNVTTITMDNGSTAEMQVRNGSKGSKGDKGDKGDSAVFDPSTGNIATIKQTTGDDTESPMSQKAVTDEFKPLKVDVGIMLPESVVIDTKFYSTKQLDGKNILYKTGTSSVGSNISTFTTANAPTSGGLSGSMTKVIPISNYNRIIFKDLGNNTNAYGSLITDADGVVLGIYANNGAQRYDIQLPAGADKLYYAVLPGYNFIFQGFRDKVSDKGYEIPFQDFRVGSISGGEPIEDTSNTWLLSLYLLSYDEVSKVKFNDGYEARVACYSSSMEYKGMLAGDLSLCETTVEKEDTAYIRILVRKQSGTISFSDDHGVTLVSPKILPTLRDKEINGVDYLTIANSSLMPLNMPERDFGTAASQGKPYTQSTSSATRLYKEVAKDMTFKGVVTNGGAWVFNTTGVSITQGHEYLCALRFKVSAYATPSGEWGFTNKPGVGMANPGTGSMPIYHTSKSGDYINIACVITAAASNQSKQISFGQFNTGYTGISAHYTDVFVVDLTTIFGSNIPTEKELYEWYNDYISIYTRVFGKDKQNEYYQNDKIARDTFISEMNHYAKELGCSSTTVFNNPSGVFDSTPPNPDNVNNFTTAADFMRIVSAYATNDKLLRLNNFISYNAAITHIDGTVSTVEVNAPCSQIAEGDSAKYLTDYYTVIGGKGGSWENQTSTLGVVAKSNVSDKWLAGYLRDGALRGNNKYALMKQLFDWAETGTAPATAPWTQAAVCYIPFNPQGCKNYDYMLHGTDETTKIAPASTTKFLTCMIAVDTLNLCDTIEVKAEDITGGSGLATLAEGDKMTVRDAVIICMYKSDNTLASALARTVGEKLIENKEV